MRIICLDEASLHYDPDRQPEVAPAIRGVRALCERAAALVWLWVSLREMDGEDPKKMQEAYDCITNMLSWAKKRDRPVVGIGVTMLAGISALIRNADVSGHARKATPQDSKTSVDQLHWDLLLLHTGRSMFRA